MSVGAEFARPVRLDTIGSAPRDEAIAADAAERAALAARFGLLSLDALSGEAALTRTGDTVEARGRLRAAAVQACVATGEPVPATIDEPFALRFVPAATFDGDEVELGEGDLDTVPYDGGAIDLGEAVAQGLALALDPFPRAPGAGDHLARAGVLSEEDAARASREAGPFAALKSLKRD